MPKVQVLLSGGVDSSVVASKLVEEGFEVSAVFLQCWSKNQLTKLGLNQDLYACTWEDDANDARLIAKKLQIPFEILNLEQEYLDYVVEYMLQEYIQGNTPNPDVMCNSEIKFGAFYKYVQDFVATGHYARKLNFRDSNYKAKKEFLEIEDFDFIARSKDKKKDQSYFLWKLKKDQLAKILFPAGEFNSKMELREYAKTRDLITANKKDSQGLCFIGKTPLRNLLATKFGLQTGKILDLNTNLVIGEHPGAFLYTIGQREKLGLSGGPWFVAKIDIKENLVYVVHNDQKEKLNKNQLKINSINLQVPNSFLQLISEKENQKYFLKILSQARYHGEICEIKINLEDLLEANYDPKKSVLVEFLNFVKSPAVGQSLVFYFDEIMLGGGVISEN